MDGPQADPLALRRADPAGAGLLWLGRGRAHGEGHVRIRARGERAAHTSEARDMNWRDEKLHVKISTFDIVCGAMKIVLIKTITAITIISRSSFY